MRDFSASDPTVISYWSCDLHALVKQLKTNIFSKMLTTTFIKFNVIFIDLTISVIKVNNNFIHQHLACIRNLVCLTWDKTVVEPKHWRVIACFLPLEDAAWISWISCAGFMRSWNYYQYTKCQWSIELQPLQVFPAGRRLNTMLRIRPGKRSYLSDSYI